jgi:acyl-[acyl carrier protein]--UDP-N-acetylglucosamine O-acyltransferase
MTALFEPHTSNESRDFDRQNIQFRGKGSYFWKRKIFAPLPPLDPDNPAAGISGEIDSLVIFNPGTFPLIGPEGVDEVISLAKNAGDAGAPVTLEGRPFFVLQVDTLEKAGLDIARADLFDRLNELRDVNVISLENRCETLDISADAAAIDRFILHLQVTELLKNDVVIEDFNHFYLEGAIPVGAGTRISTGVVIKGASEIGKNVNLYPHAYIENSVVGDNCTILPGCIVRDSSLEKDVQIGPYTHLRNGVLVKEGAKMGNFVEMKKSVLGKGSKAMHLSYVGDAEVGEKVNIGAGTITCNYDGVKKSKTIIEDNVFIGSGTELVAPVAVRKNSYVGAGSTITEEVPPDSLAVARQKQRNIPGWVKRKRRG